MDLRYLLLSSLILIIFYSGCIQSKESANQLIDKAIQTQEVSYCEKIDDLGYKNQCYFKLSDSFPELCRKIKTFFCRDGPCFLDDELLGECYLNRYNKTKNESLCVEMEHYGGSYNKVKTCFTEAGYSGDAFCKKFKTSYHNFWNCYMNDLKVELNLTEAQCIQFSQISEDAKTRCYRDLAAISGNESFCHYSSEGSLDLGYCITDVAVARNNSSLCDIISSHCYVSKRSTGCKPDALESGETPFPEYCKDRVRQLN